MTTLTFILPTLLFAAVFLSTDTKQAIAESTGPNTNPFWVNVANDLNQPYFHRGSGRRGKLPNRPK